MCECYAIHHQNFCSRKPTQQLNAYLLVMHCSTYCVIIIQRDAELTELVMTAKSSAAKEKNSDSWERTGQIKASDLGHKPRIGQIKWEH